MADENMEVDPVSGGECKITDTDASETHCVFRWWPVVKAAERSLRSVTG